MRGFFATNYTNSHEFFQPSQFVKLVEFVVKFSAKDEMRLSFVARRTSC